jgi:predicted acylesterase/phospholipase RssA/CRP-like cAMP-binding protein
MPEPSTDPDFPGLLACTAERLPTFRQALLALPAGSLGVVQLRAGDMLLRRGEPAHALHVVASGLLRTTGTLADGSVATLSAFHRGDIAGEMASLGWSGQCRASVSAQTDVVLVEVPLDVFERIAAQAPEAVREVSEGMRRRILRDQFVSGLTRLFGEMQAELLRYLEARVQWVRLPAGETLFQQGDTSRDVYFILGGRLRALSRSGRVMSEMGRGESIGEIALLTGEPRTATVEAVRDSDLVRMTPEVFDEVVTRYPLVMQAVTRIIVQRLRDKEGAAQASVPKKCIAVLGLGGKAASADFCTRLARGLARIGSVMQLSAPRVEALLEQPGIAQAEPDQVAGTRLAAWLDEQEAATQFLVCEADAGDSPWTRRCLRQADEILLVADAAAGPAPGALESGLLGARGVSGTRQTLVLLHDDGRRLPSGTSRWYGGRRLHGHFHVRLDTEGDFERVARCLAGVAVGVVFGGGGARGLAHIGVVRALREAGTPIDMIGGTSMGAVIAGVVGMGMDWQRILDISRVGWLRYRPHREYTLPLVSIVRSKVLDRWVREIYAETEIEDLWLSFFCVSCNLTRRDMAVFERGPLGRAIRASAALPGLFVPVVVDGEVHVDGAIVNNLPGDIMRQRACKTLIAVDVGSVPAFACSGGEFPSPWRLLWHRIMPFVKRLEVPNIGAILMRTTEVGSAARTAEVVRDADLCLRPPIDAFGVLEFARIDEIVETGFRHAQQALRERHGDPRLAGMRPWSDEPAAGGAAAGMLRS